jgi:methylamine methyltransferase corrinoid activation protein
MSGATGTYVDAEKARHLGSVPGFIPNIVQFGNTSIGLARKLAVDPIKLCDVISVAKKIHADHLMMATSETFKDIYLCELSYWQQGMPLEIYDQMLQLYKIKPFPENLEKVNIERRVSKDIDDVGEKGIEIVKDIGIILEAPVIKCIMCHKCEKDCPEDAVIIIEREGKRFANIDSQHCLGTSCRRCVTICPEQTMNHSILKVKR